MNSYEFSLKVEIRFRDLRAARLSVPENCETRAHIVDDLYSRGVEVELNLVLTSLADVYLNGIHAALALQAAFEFVLKCICRTQDTDFLVCVAALVSRKEFDERRVIAEMSKDRAVTTSLW